jgi:hypothetical protein
LDYLLSICSSHAGLRHNNDICGAFFELHPYDLEKLSDKLVKPQATKNRPAAVGFVTQA